MIKFDLIKDITYAVGEGWEFAQVGDVSKLDSIGQVDAFKAVSKLLKVKAQLVGDNSHYSGTYSLKDWNKLTIKTLVNYSKESKMSYSEEEIESKIGIFKKEIT